MYFKVFLNSLLVLVALMLQQTEAKKPGITLSMTDNGNQDDKTTATCTLKMDDLEVSALIAHGDNAPDGFPGLDGPPGEKGSMGEPGRVPPLNILAQYEGQPGIKGPMGDRGMDGLPGMPGSEGNIDDSKDGVNGIPGFPGYKGESGDKGGCGCISGENFGTKESPATVTCKSAPPGVLSGTYYLGPPAKPFLVFCNMETKETCIRRKLDFSPGNDSFERKGWMSSQISDATKNTLLYNDLSTEQITWLQMRSTTARQKLTYICYNIRGGDKDFDLTSAMLLLTWNDMVIGSNQTSEYPFSYYIPPDYHYCSQENLRFTTLTSDIELKTSMVNRLPITDMWLEDIGDSEERIGIQNTELCFR